MVYLPDTLLQRSVVGPILCIMLTAILELTCIDEARRLYRSNKSLYVSAWFANIFNNVFVGGLTYYWTVRCFCQDKELSVAQRLISGVGVPVIQSLLYYGIHRAFHEVKGLYWIHSYHHKFNKIVLPSSANAVSVNEYVTAYMFPLVVAVVLTGADEIATFSGPAIPVVANLLIHTPRMEAIRYPWMFVSTEDHLNHHRRLTGDYAAPILHADRIVDRLLSFSPATRKQN